MNTLTQLATLLRAVGSIEGRKKLQKIVHILQEFGVPFDVRYGYHHYGPFSEELQEALQSFKHDGLIKEEPVSGSFPTSRFTATDELISVLEQVGTHEDPKWGTFATELNSKTPRELEAISTLVYLERNTQMPEDGQIDSEFIKLKTNLKELLPATKQTLKQFQEKYVDLAVA